MKIEEVMYFLFGQDYKASGSRQWSRQNHNSWKQQCRVSQRAYLTEEHDDDNDDEAYVYDDMPYYEQAPEYDETVMYESEDTFYTDALPDETYDPNLEQGMWEDDGGDDEMEEAYSMYLDARKRPAELKAACGYWPVVAVPPDGTGPTTSPPSSGGPPSKGKSREKALARV